MKQAIISPQHRQDCKRVPEGFGPGTYVLLLRVAVDWTCQVGKLGRLTFCTGFYLYVGSAQGRGGISGRLRHHLNPSAVPHWHIDYLAKVATLEEIWYQESQTKQEHNWAAILSTLRGIPLAGFGSSDCRCQSHLFLFVRRPRINSLRKALRDLEYEAQGIKMLRVRTGGGPV